MASLTGKRKKGPTKHEQALIDDLRNDPVSSKLVDKTAVLENPRASEPGPRLLDPSTFDEAAYHIPVPLVTASALRAYIERQARPLEKVIRIANGQEVNGHRPSWEDQKEAVYCLVDKVAPNLSAVEINDVSDPEAGTKAQGTVSKLIDALTELALQKRAGGASPITIENDRGED